MRIRVRQQTAIATDGDRNGGPGNGRNSAVLAQQKQLPAEQQEQQKPSYCYCFELINPL